MVDCTQWSNVIVIAGSEKEYSDPNEILSDPSLGPQTLVIQLVRNMHDEVIFFYNNNSSILKRQLPYSRLIIAKTMREAMELCDGKNPFAIIDVEHGNKYWGIGDGKGNWQSTESIAHLINKNVDKIQFLTLPMCHSWFIGNQLVKLTEKILILDARYKDEPCEGLHFYDGDINKQRFESKTIRTFERWQNEFIKIHKGRIVSQLATIMNHKTLKSQMTE
jgi:hypothetical protein